ncbi:hypothetical protein SLE2022_012990 [Rubroshorea leprosula]
MYPFERRMRKLKSTIGNKNHVEASIVEAFILYEISHFCSRYFGDDVETSWNQPPRNYGGIGTNVPGKLSVFCSLGEPIRADSRTRCLTLEEKDAAELYVLLNCKEVDVWVTKFEEEVGANLSHEQLQRLRTNNFVQWFKNRCLVDNMKSMNNLSILQLARSLKTTRGWLAACKIKSRHVIETSSTSSSGEVDDIFQDDDPSIMQGSSLAIDLTTYQSLQLSAEGVTEVEVDANTSEEEEDYGEEKDSESSGNSDNVEDGDDSDDSDD